MLKAGFLAGLADASKEPDIEVEFKPRLKPDNNNISQVESVITRQFASEVSDYIVSGCLQLIGKEDFHIHVYSNLTYCLSGANVNLETSKYQQYLRDNLVIQGWQGSSNLNKCFVALSCLMHLIQHKPQLAQLRQPADGNFLKSFKFQLTNVKHNLNR